MQEYDGAAMSEPGRIRILSVDGHPLMQQGIAAIVASQPDMALIAQAASGRGGIERFRECAPDVTLMDSRLRDMSGVDAMVTIRREFPQARVIILTAFDGATEANRALEAGARSYLLKCMPPAEILEAIRSVHAGRRPIPTAVAVQLAQHLGDARLTARETEVLRHIAEGNRNRAIARKLFVSEDTVKVHVKHLLDKLGAADRSQAVYIGLRRGILAL